jgi:hypothetical protein
MNQVIITSLSTFALVVLVVAPAFGKGQTVKLTVSGPGISQPIDVTDRDAISASAWGNDFFDVENGPIAAPDAALPRYVVQFYVQPPQGGAVEMKYAVYLVLDRTAGRAMVYLPEPRDELYRLNSAMVREGQEGKWYFASAKWSRALRVALAKP